MLNLRSVCFHKKLYWIKSSVTLVIDECFIYYKRFYVYFTLISGDVPDKEMQLTGVYDLIAVLTHQGRSADSGHYVAWVKQESGMLFSKSITQNKECKEESCFCTK